MNKKATSKYWSRTSVDTYPGQCTDYRVLVLRSQEYFMKTSPLRHFYAHRQNQKSIPWKKILARSPVILRQASFTSVQYYCLRVGVKTTIKYLGPQRSQCSLEGQSPERDSLRGRRSKGRETAKLEVRKECDTQSRTTRANRKCETRPECPIHEREGEHT